VPTKSQPASRAIEEVELRGHIIDSLLLPKILDQIMAAGGTFLLKNVLIGQTRADPSSTLIEISAPTRQRLDEILAQVANHGAVRVHEHDCSVEPVDIAGAFPENFYSTTNQRTEVRLSGKWVPVDRQEMDCGIVVDEASAAARCVPMLDTRLGDRIVVGHTGVRVFPPERQREAHGFEFMNSAVSTEKPKHVAIRQVALELFRAKREGNALLVGGPAIVHSGSGKHLCELIRKGYFKVLFAGNALATHDIEQSLYSTSLGVQLEKGDIVEAGHEHHLRAINRIRRAGGIKPAVEKGILKSGIMYDCVKQGVDYVLCGSIRDDGPLPDVITDIVESQRVMREKVQGVTFCLMIATTLHSIAVGNLLPAWVNVVCVDINPSTVIKLNDRGSFQTVGIVTDVEPFMRVMVQEIERLEAQEAQEQSI
jgi:lysine-ketoglutarate reductase/saccharopine dehydrogenase-like protein (TIGR00300 family)